MSPASPRPRLRVELFENIHPAAHEVLQRENLQVGLHAGPFRLRDLRGAHALGMRSRSALDGRAMETAPDLLVVGCFAVGTNNVDVDAAARLGLPVFHAPHSSTRSVAELTMGLLISLARGIVRKSHLARKGVWAKSADGSHEVRGKTLGIVGYGHIGSQVSILAEALGLSVVYFDVADVQSLGNARPMPSLERLLAASDFVTLHVPGGQGTDGLMNAARLRAMKPGAALINTSRGSVVDEKALLEVLREGHLSGAALDVLATEPASAKSPLRNRLRHRDDVILTPHVGGSTAEAQRRIGESVARKMAAYLRRGSTQGAKNFPQVDLPRHPGTHRLTHVHRNVPGVLSSVNSILSDLGANVLGQFLETHREIGYLVIDVDVAVSAEVLRALDALPVTIRARRLT